MFIEISFENEDGFIRNSIKDKFSLLDYDISIYFHQFNRLCQNNNNKKKKTNKHNKNQRMGTFLLQIFYCLPILNHIYG